MSLERKFIDVFQPGVREKLLLCLENIERVDQFPKDPLHDERHYAAVDRNAIWIADEYDLDRNARDLLHQAVQGHDDGYAFERMGIISPQEHNIASALLTLHRTGDIGVARGVYLHSFDILPEGTPDWIWVLREADRADRVGWFSLVLLAHYMGFKHSLVNGSLEYQLNIDGNREVFDGLRDKRHPYNV